MPSTIWGPQWLKLSTISMCAHCILGSNPPHRQNQHCLVGIWRWRNSIMIIIIESFPPWLEYGGILVGILLWAWQDDAEEEEEEVDLSNHDHNYNNNKEKITFVPIKKITMVSMVKKELLPLGPLSSW